MKKRLAVLAAGLTAVIGVAAGNGFAADQARDQLRDGSCDSGPIHDQTQDQLRIHLNW
jgi:hypothetical protein